MKKTLSIFLSLLMMISVFSGFTTTAHAAVLARSFSARTTIPTASNTWIKKYNTSNNCTRYAYGRISEILNTDATSILGARPGANSFPSILSRAGYSYGTTPKAGSVMCTSGHVAIVEWVNGDGTLVVSEGHSWTNMSSNSNIYNRQVKVDGKDVIGRSTLTTDGKGIGTWFDLRKINYRNTNAKYYYLVSPDTQKPEISNVSVTRTAGEGYTVKFTATDNIGVTRVYCPTWTVHNDQDDLNWYEPITKSGNNYTCTVSISRHNNELGKYATHIYAYDEAGNSTCFIVNGNNTKVYPKKPTNVKITAKSKGFTVKWRKPSGPFTGYKILYATSKSAFQNNGYKEFKISSSSTSCSKSKLIANKTYYVKVVSYYSMDGVSYLSSSSIYTVKTLY